VLPELPLAPARPAHSCWSEENAPAAPVTELSAVENLIEVQEGELQEIDCPSEGHESTSPRWLKDWQRRLMDVYEQIDGDCSGSIDLSELKRVFVAADLPEKEAEDFMKMVDTSGDGVIDRAEWLHMLEFADENTASGEWLKNFSETIARLQAKNGRIYPSVPEVKYFCILRQDSFKRMGWDMFLMLLLFYIAVSLPFTMGFGATKTSEEIDRTIDYIFLVDVALNFRTSYTNRDGVMVVKSRKIAWNYLKSWCVLDLVSSLPLGLLTAGLMPSMQPAKLLKIGKIMKVFKMLRLGKITKVFRESEFMGDLQERFVTKSNTTAVKIFNLMTIMLLLCHWLACMMGLSGQNWNLGLRTDESQFGRYLSAMYWAMTTLTTVGYGDITPIGDVELVYCVMAMVVGGSFYGFIVGRISECFSQNDYNTQQTYKRMEEVNTWLEHHAELPRSLRRRIRNYFKNSLLAKSAVHDSMIIDDLTPSLVHDVSFFLVKDEVRNNHLFVNLPESALSLLMPILVKSIFEPGERIVSRGDPGKAMYVISEGRAHFEQGHQYKGTISDHSLAAGDSFGEEIVLQLEDFYQYTVVVDAHSCMYVVTEGAFEERFKHYPAVRKIMLENFKSSKEGAEWEAGKNPDLSLKILTILKELSTRFTAMETKMKVAVMKAGLSDIVGPARQISG